jgi:hypothetical protein
MEIEPLALDPGQPTGRRRMIERKTLGGQVVGVADIKHPVLGL